MSEIIKIPSKTFLVGEYIALEGGPSLVACTEPSFEFSLENFDGATAVKNEGPIGEFLSAKGISLYKKDPHQGKGGFGASTAEFLAASYFCESQEAELMSDYLNHYWQGKGYKPSGADLLAQNQGAVVEVSADGVVPLDWPFADKDFFILRTGVKVPTHKHLEEVKNIPFAKLKISAQETCEAFMNANWDKFTQGINEYSKILQIEGLVAESSLDLLEEFSGDPDLAALKANGALGADTITLFFAKEHRDYFKETIDELKLDIVADSSSVTAQVSGGLCG